MIFYYIILLLYNSNFANTSFIIDPIYAENTINCKNNTYAINSMISFNNAIIKDSLSLNTYFNNTNSIVLNNNSSEGIQFLNLPIMQPDNYYLTLNDKNILSIYINNSNKINDIVYYDVIEAQNILSGKYENLFLNSLNTYILIGTEGLTTSITIHGAQTFFPKLITSYSPDIPIILSANQSNYIIFNKSIEVVNTVKNPTNNTMIFENFNIKKVIDTNVSLPFTTNITFLKNLEIHGDQLNFITINIIPSNQILNCNNQEIGITGLNSSNVNNFIQIDQNNNCYKINLTLPTNSLNAFNTNLNTIMIKNGSNFFGPLIIKPINKKEKNILQFNNLNVKNFYLQFYPNNIGNNVIANNFIINNLEYDSFENIVNKANNIYIKLINLDIQNGIKIMNNDVILSSKNIYLGSLYPHPSNGLLGFDVNGILCLESNTNNNYLLSNIDAKNKNYTEKKNRILEGISNFKIRTQSILNDLDEKLEIEMKKKLYQLMKEIMQL